MNEIKLVSVDSKNKVRLVKLYWEKENTDYLLKKEPGVWNGKMILQPVHRISWHSHPVCSWQAMEICHSSMSVYRVPIYIPTLRLLWSNLPVPILPWLIYNCQITSQPVLSTEPWCHRAVSLQIHPPDTSDVEDGKQYRHANRITFQSVIL